MYVCTYSVLYVGQFCHVPSLILYSDIKEKTLQIKGNVKDVIEVRMYVHPYVLSVQGVYVVCTYLKYVRTYIRTLYFCTLHLQCVLVYTVRKPCSQAV